jgi:hypothetical protein
MIAKAISSIPGSQASPYRNPSYSRKPAPTLVMKRPVAGLRQTPMERQQLPAVYGLATGNPINFFGSALSTALCWQSCAMHMWRELSCLSPWHSACFEIANRMLAAGAESVMCACGAPPIRLLRAPETCPGGEAAVPPEVLERAMDIAIGERLA